MSIAKFAMEIMKLKDIKRCSESRIYIELTESSPREHNAAANAAKV